jgi:dTDP-4-dehydrorhamnose reductase
MIWIIGSKGMLGQELCLTLKNAGLDYTGTDKEIDILSSTALAEKAEEISPDWIVNCSAYTAVDQAEDDSEMAYKINKDGVQNIAELANKLDIPVIHISTDYVFDGTSEKPLHEDAPTSPIGVYGKSKLEGEEVLQKNCSKYFIIRTAWLYGQFGPNFIYTMIKLMNKLDSIKVVDDQIGSPTWAKDLTNLISLIMKRNNAEYGIYHFSGEGQCSWFDFAREICSQGRNSNLISSECQINPCASSEFPTKAERPAFSLLSKKKVKVELNILVPLWQESLKSFIKGINANDII